MAAVSTSRTYGALVICVSLLVAKTCCQTFTSVVSSNGNFIAVSSGGDGVTWSEARQYCLDEYVTDLAKISSSTENTEVYDALVSVGKGNTPDAWIGLHDSSTEGSFEWVNNGLELTNVFSNWKSGEPNNFFTAQIVDGEDCVYMHKDFGSWNDYLCDPTEIDTWAIPAFICASANGANKLCNRDEMSIIKGEWTYNKNECSLSNDDTASGNVIWFGNPNGDTPHVNYNNDNSFVFIVEMAVSGDNYDGGVLFRSRNVSPTNDDGEQYYFGLYPSTNAVTLGRMDGTWNSLKTVSVEINPDTIYTIKIVASGTSYDFYVDDTMVIEGYTLSEYTDGSIGLRTFNNPSTYYSVRYSNDGGNTF